MKKTSAIVLFLSFLVVLNAQDKPNSNTKKTLKQKANDHFMLQFTGDTWAGKPDSIATKSFGRGANIYVMMDYPFKSNPHFSAAIGVGFGTSGIYLDETQADLDGTSQNLKFRRVDTVNHFKKYKIATAFFEAPVEIRWIQNPTNSDKSFKVALGAKVGTLLSAGSKGKTLLDKNDATINSYTEKIKSRKYFNSTRIALAARLGYGHFSVFGQYQLTGVFKENIGPEVRPYSIGIALSGL